MRKFTAAVLGATGMVGQQYVSMLARHPYFELTCITGKESVGKPYGNGARWLQVEPIPERVRDMEVLPTEPDAVKDVDIVFSPLPTDAARDSEPAFAKAGFTVVSDASAHRMEPDVPLVIPEVNAEHLALARVQRQTRKWEGMLITTPNCTAVGLALVLKPLHDAFGVRRVILTTMQAVSGAGFPGVPSLTIMDNVIPYISDEEQKVPIESQKILGRLNSGHVEPAPIEMTASCNRVATMDGHMECAYVQTECPVEPAAAIRAMEAFRARPQHLKLPTAPEQPILVRAEPDRPQTRLDRLAGSVPGMSAVVGRVRQGLRPDELWLTLLSHNTIRGAAGSTILLGELMAADHFLGG